MRGKHSTFNIQHRTSKVGADGRALANGGWIFLFLISLGSVALGSANDTTNADNFIPPPRAAQETARGFYNAGTEKLRAGKLNDAETLLESSLAKQDERVQPASLFNLGHVRFAQGSEELKKTPGGTAKRNRAATEAGAGAIQKATDALAGNDVQQMVEAYFAGRGVQKEIRTASEAVKRALEAHGKTLLKWRRSLNDFQGASELNPMDTNAVHNADVVAQAIAKLVDNMKQMQQSAAGLNGKKSELGELLKQLKGRIPAPNSPPGAPGEEGEEDEDGKDGKQPMPESLAGCWAVVA